MGGARAANSSPRLWASGKGACGPSSNTFATTTSSRSSRLGISISNKGTEFFNGFPIQVGMLSKSDATLGTETVAVLVRGHKNRVKIGVEQRDAAVRVGADGATTILVQGGDLWVPPDFCLDKERPDFAAELRDIFSVREGDVIIIGTGADYHKAEDGALAAAFELI